MVRIEDEEFNYLDNLKTLRKKIKNDDLEKINNWDSYSKKNDFTGIIKLKKNNINDINYIKYSNKLIKNLILSLKPFLNFEYSEYKINQKKINTIDFLFNKYNLVNVGKLNTIKKIEYSAVTNIISIILDTRSSKTKIVINKNNKNLLSLTNGVILKKLMINDKKYKKSDKIVFLMLKSALIKSNYLKNYKNIIIILKGLKKSSNNFLNYVYKNIKLNSKNILIVNNYKTSRNSFFKFKKIGAIKRKLKKKLVKFK